MLDAPWISILLQDDVSCWDEAPGFYAVIGHWKHYALAGLPGLYDVVEHWEHPPLAPNPVTPTLLFV